MITITLQRNDNKSHTDKISFDENTITINEQAYEFEQGKDLAFQSPHEQIINPHRDAEGVLHAMVIRQYIGADKHIAENNSDDNPFLNADRMMMRSKSGNKNSIIKPQNEEEPQEKTVQQAINEKEDEIKHLKDQYLDADLDDNEDLKSSLKVQIQEARKELSISPNPPLISNIIVSVGVRTEKVSGFVFVVVEQNTP